jgi:hypothetical protein
LTGGTGKGKSWCALGIAEIYSKMFNIEFDPNIHVIHSLKEILQLITSDDVDKVLKVGSVVVFEELQVSANSRDWQGESNRGLNRLVSTFRDKRLVVLFTTPIIGFIDKQSRQLFHGEFELLGFDKNTKISKVKPRFLTPKSHGEDFYRPRLIIEFAVEGKAKHKEVFLNNWDIPRASDYIIDIYEAKKRKFNDELNRKELNRIELSEKQAQSKNKSDDLLKVKDLYDKYGEDYIEISKEMPHLSPLSLEKLVLLIKRTLKTKERAKV